MSIRVIVESICVVVATVSLTAGLGGCKHTDTTPTEKEPSGCLIDSVAYGSGTANPANACQSCDPDASLSAWTSAADGTSCGNGQICGQGLCGSECDIGGTIESSGSANPENACQTCQPGTSTGGWTSLANGASCGTGAACMNGACDAGCFIDGGAYSPGAANPENACEVCAPNIVLNAWSPASDGTTCGAGAACLLGSCTVGCFIDGGFYDAGSAAHDDPCQLCQPNASVTSWTSAANGASCGNGQVCAAGACGTMCDIDGSVVDSGASNPGNACQLCAPGTSLSAWSNRSNGVSCGSGSICDDGVCDAGCFIDGAMYAATADNAGNVCQICAPGTSTTGWSNVADGLACDAGMECRTGACAFGCFIDGGFYDAGATVDDNPCQVCEPDAGTTASTALRDGTDCGGDQICSSGVCGTECDIDGSVVGTGSLSPGNSCQSCQPGTNTTGYTLRGNGSSCGGGFVCFDDACDASCVILDASFANDADNDGNTCQVCAPGSSTSAWTPLMGLPCGDGGLCNAGSCAIGCFFGDTFYDAGTLENGNVCESCQPDAAMDGWTPVGNGTQCDAGATCYEGACQPGCFISGDGGGFFAPDATNPESPCQICRPSESTTEWTNIPDDTECGSGTEFAQYCQSGACNLCVHVVTAWLGEQPGAGQTPTTVSPFATTVTYLMVGGGGGGAGSDDITTGQAWDPRPGITSAIYYGAEPNAIFADGGAGANVDGGGSPSWNGLVASGSFVVDAGDPIAVLVGGGGAGSGYFREGAESNTSTSACGYRHGAGGSGTAGGNGIAPYNGGGGGGSGCGGGGGAGGGGTSSGSYGGGGGGGGGGGPGGAGGNGGDATDAPDASLDSGSGGIFGAADDDAGTGGYNGGNGGTCEGGGGIGGLGASNWSGYVNYSLALPAAAGQGGASATTSFSGGNGGNAGLVILEYTSPTNVCGL